MAQSGRECDGPSSSHSTFFGHIEELMLVVNRSEKNAEACNSQAMEQLAEHATGRRRSHGRA